MAIRISKNDDHDDNGIHLYTVREQGTSVRLILYGEKGEWRKPSTLSHMTSKILYHKSDLNFFISFFHPSFPFFFHVKAETITLEVPTAPCLIAFNSIRSNLCFPSIGIQLFQSEHSNGWGIAVAWLNEIKIWPIKAICRLGCQQIKIIMAKGRCLPLGRERVKTGDHNLLEF